MRPGLMKLARAKRLTRASGLLRVMLLAGCTQWHYDLGTPLTDAQLPDPASTQSLREVLARLGPPQRVSATVSGYVLAWEYWEIKEDTIGISLGAMGADLLSVDWGKARVKGDFLLLSFDHQHQLTSSNISHWQGDTGGGRAIQPMLGLVSMVDVEDLVDDLPHHEWGATMLQPLPKAINRASRPDTGQNGIQRRGTPAGIGQQSLE